MFVSPRLKAACLAGACLTSALVIIYIINIMVRHQEASASTTIILIMASVGMSLAQVLVMFYSVNAFNNLEQALLPTLKTMPKKMGGAKNTALLFFTAIFLALLSMFAISMSENMPDRVSLTTPRPTELLFFITTTTTIIIAMFSYMATLDRTRQST